MCFFNNKNIEKLEERLRILEIKIDNIENPNNPYKCNPRGRTWKYHIITEDGKIIEKR